MEFPAGVTEMLERRLSFMERMFGGDAELRALRAEAPTHPAVLAYNRTRYLIARGLRLKDERVFLDAATILDAGVAEKSWGELVEPAPGDFWGFLGPQRAHFLSELVRPDKYQDRIVELFVYWWLRRCGLNPRFEDRNGLPDIFCDGADGSVVPVEAKHTTALKNPARIEDVIKSASRQLRRADSGAGLAYVYCSRVHRPRTESVPDIVRAAAREGVKRFRGGSHRRLAVLTIMWDDYDFGSADQPGVEFHIRRRSVALVNANAQQPSVAREATSPSIRCRLSITTHPSPP